MDRVVQYEIGAANVQTAAHDIADGHLSLYRTAGAVTGRKKVEL
jgi:hypothetical protein